VRTKFFYANWQKSNSTPQPRLPTFTRIPNKSFQFFTSFFFSGRKLFFREKNATFTQDPSRGVRPLSTIFFVLGNGQLLLLLLSTYVCTRRQMPHVKPPYKHGPNNAHRSSRTHTLQKEHRRCLWKPFDFIKNASIPENFEFNSIPKHYVSNSMTWKNIIYIYTYCYFSARSLAYSFNWISRYCSIHATLCIIPASNGRPQPLHIYIFRCLSTEMPSSF
jgi:hypothetical protein